VTEEETKAIELFYSYAHEDETLRSALEKHLSNLKRQGLIAGWHDHKITAGAEAAQEIAQHLNTATIILLLISPDFIASDYCYCVELMQAIARHAVGEARVIPVILRPTDCKGAPFANLRCLPSDGKAITSWSNLDEAFLDVAQGIRSAVEEISAVEKRDLAAQRDQYCETLYERWHMLDFKGIMHVDMNRPMSIPLTDVFVLPDVMVGVPEYETLERKDVEGDTDSNDEKQARRVQDEEELPTYLRYQQLQETSQRSEKRIVLHREELQTVLVKNHRLIILGDPGSGKSTLLRYMMLLLAQGSLQFCAIFPQLADALPAIPLYITLATYAEAWSSCMPGERSLKHFLPRYLRENYLEAYASLILQELERGRVFVLLDGLDEIPDASLRMQIVRQVEMFTQSFPANRFIITSRIVGYKEAPLAAEYQEYTLADFNEKQIKEFMQQWCPAYERWVKGTTDNEYLQKLATREAEKMFRSIQRKSAVKKLTVNPLLLTIVALIQRQGIELPGHRIELFDLCAMTLIDTWVKAKGVETSTTFSKNNLIKLLRPLAFWMHEHPTIGAIPEEELTEQIVKQLLARKITRHEDEASQLAEQFLGIVRGKTGILIERGKKRYGFLHLTFEEYFAAGALEIREDREDFIKAHLHDSRWREVILLTVGSIGILHSNEQGVTRVVQQAILNANSRFEKWLHRDLLFAGTCLADDVGVSIECEDEIIERIIYLYITSPFDSLRTAIDDTIREWSGTPIATKAAKMLLWLLKKRDVAVDVSAQSLGIPSAETYRLQEKVDTYCQNLINQRRDALNNFLYGMVTAIHPLPETTQDGISLLITTLSDPDHKLRQAAIQILGKLEQGRPDVVDALLQCLSDPDWRVRQVVVQVLRQFGQKRSDVIDPLIQCLDDPDKDVKRAAAIAMEQMKQGAPEVIAALLDHLSDSNVTVRQAIITTLGRVGKDNPEVIDVLLKNAFDDDADIRRTAISALGQLERGIPSVTSALLMFLSSPNEQVRQVAAQALGQSGREHPEMIQQLLKLISDVNWQVRQAGAIALGEAGCASPEVINALLKLVSDADLDVRQAAINTLGQLGKGYPEVIDILLGCLHTPYNLEVQAVIRSLERLGESSSSVIEALLKLLSDPNPNIRQAATKALGELGQSNSSVIGALLKLLSDTHAGIQKVAVQALGQLRQGNPEVIEPLLQLLAEADTEMKCIVISALGKMRADSSVIEALLKLVPDPDTDISQAAVGALTQIGQEHPEIVDSHFWELILSAIDLGGVELSIQKSAGKLNDRMFEIFKNLLIMLPDTLVATHLSKTDFAQEIDRYKENLSIQLVAKAVRFLKAVGHNSSQVIAALFGLLSHTNAQVKRTTVQTLGEIGQEYFRTAEALLPLLSDTDWQVRQATAQALGEMKQGSAEVIEALLGLLVDVNPQVKQAAIQTLGQVGQGSAEVIEALCGQFSAANWQMSQAVMQALEQLGQGQSRVIEALLSYFSEIDYLFGPPDLSGTLPQALFKALKQLGKGQQDFIDILLKRIANVDSDWLIKLASVRALGMVGQGRPEVVEALLKQLSDTNVSVKWTSAQALGMVGQGRPEVVEALLKQLSDTNTSVRRASTQALGMVGQGRPEVVDVLVKQLADSNALVKQAAVRALGQVGQGGSEVIEALLKQLSDSDRQVKQAVVQILGQVGQGRPEVIEALLKQLSDSSSNMQIATVKALEQLGSGESRIVDALLKIVLSSAFLSSRQAAVNTLAALPINRTIVSERIEKLLQDYEPISNGHLYASVDSLLAALLKIVG